MKRSIAVLLVASLLLSLIGCAGEGNPKAMPLDEYRERFNILCTELDYEAYLVSSQEITTTSSSFQTVLLTGLFSVSGEMSGGRMDSISITFTDPLIEYISTAADYDAVMLSTFYLLTLLLVPLTEEYEVSDKDSLTEFMSQTLFPSFEGVKKVGNYKMSSVFLTADKTSVLVSLNALSS